MSISSVITQALAETIARQGTARIAFPGGRSAVGLMSERRMRRLIGHRST